MNLMKRNTHLTLLSRGAGVAAITSALLGAPLLHAQEKTTQITGTSTTYVDVATDGSLWIAVGNDGHVATSTDGSTWTETELSASLDLEAVAAGDGMFVLGGENGELFTTVDGQSFTELDFQFNGTIDEIVHAQGAWHVTTSAGLYATSQTGADWTLENSDDSRRFLELAVDGDTMYALVVDSTVDTDSGVSVEYESHLVVRSAVGGEWNEENVDGEVTALFGSEGAIFITVTKDTNEGVEESTLRLNGSTMWSLILNTRIEFDGLRIVLEGSASAELTTQSSRDASMINGHIVLVGSTEANAEGESSAIIRLNLLGDASSEDAHGALSLNAIASDGSLAVAVGANGRIMTSTDGETWNSADVETSALVFTDISFANDLFVATAMDGEANGSLVFTTTDGEAWTSIDLSATTEANAAISTNDGILVVGSDASGDASIEWIVSGSSNGAATISSTIEGSLHAALEADGHFYAAGDNQTLLVSTDGSTWTEATLNGSIGVHADASFRSMASNGTEIVAVGDEGMVAVSTDGTTFTEISTDLEGNFSAVVSGETEVEGESSFVLVGENGLILTSEDGTTWTDVSLKTTADFTAATYANGSFYLRTDEGATYVSEDLTGFIRVEATGSSESHLAAAGNGHLIGVGEGEQAEVSATGNWDASYAINGQWRLSLWFGYLYTMANSHWTYHLEHGWIFTRDSSLRGTFYYSAKLQSWAYTNARIYPYIYVFNGEYGWTYYARGTSGNWYYSFRLNAWVDLSAE